MLYPRAALVAALLGSMISLSVAQGREQPPTVSHDGLKLTSSKNVALLYVREGASLAGYHKVMLDPVQVAFDKQWSRDRRDISEDERERIRTELAEEFHKVFEQELEKSGSYEIVSTGGADVLRVTAVIVDLFVTAPDVNRAGRNKSYTVSAGRMTLIAELRDTESGAILARVADRKEASNFNTFTWTTRASNTADARRILKSWAGALRNGLDAARSS